MVIKMQQGGIRGANDRVIKEVSVRRLENGKFQGVFTWLRVNGVDNLEVEVLCKEHRDTKQEALQDATDAADKN